MRPLTGVLKAWGLLGRTKDSVALAGPSLLPVHLKANTPRNPATWCPCPNNSCQGGLMDYAFQYIRQVGGLETEAGYPYYAQNRNCEFDQSRVAASLTGFVDVTRGDEEALKQAVATVGP